MALAQPASPQARPPIAAPPANAQPTYYQRLRQRGVSAAGIQILSQLDARARPDSQRLDERLVAVNREVAALIDAPAVDLVRLRDALTRPNGILAERTSRSSAALMEYLQALTPADRQIVVRSVGLPTTRR
jgi:hypothetical protein